MIDGDLWAMLWKYIKCTCDWSFDYEKCLAFFKFENISNAYYFYHSYYVYDYKVFFQHSLFGSASIEKITLFFILNIIGSISDLYVINSYP